MSVLTGKISISIDGIEEKTYDDYEFSEIQLVQELQRPNEFRFLMRKKQLLENQDDVRFTLSEKLLGKSVTFSLNTISPKENKKDKELGFSGIIFNANIVRNNLKASAVIEVIAYSKDYLLFDSPHCFSYEKYKLKDIVSKILEPYDIAKEDINPNFTEDIPYTVQYNETNYGFLSRLAYRYGEWLYYNNNENKLIFGKIKKSETMNLKYGKDVLSYQYRLDLEHLNFTHAHHNYLEYVNTQKSGYDVTDFKMHRHTETAYDYSNDLYKKATFQHLNASNPEDGFDETEISAKIQGLGKKAQMMVCRGSSNRADLSIGSVINIIENFQNEENTKNNKIDSCPHDELLICRIAHYVDNMGNYENEFTGIPKECEVPPYAYGDFTPKAETQRAVVKDNKDPNKLGRVRVQFLWQKEQDETNLMTPWIRIAQPHGGDNKGFYFIPEIGEEVMVGFENGNAEKPYVVGTLYHSNGQHPLAQWCTDENTKKAIRTRCGHTIQFVDGQEEGGHIAIYNAALDKEKHVTYAILLDVDKKLIKLISKGNIELHAENDIILRAGNDIAMKADHDFYREADNDFYDFAHNDILIQADNDINTKAKKDYVMEAGGVFDYTVKGDQNIEVKGKKEETITGKYKLGAQEIEEEAKTSMKLSSAQHEQTAKATMKIDGGQSLDVKGTMVKIN